MRVVVQTLRDPLHVPVHRLDVPVDNFELRRPVGLRRPIIPSQQNRHQVHPRDHLLLDRLIPINPQDPWSGEGVNERKWPRLESALHCSEMTCE